MKACDDKLKDSLMEAMELDVARLKAEMEKTEPHTFSPEFEQKMEKLIREVDRKSKMRSAWRFAAAAVIVALLTGGILFIGSDDLRASEMSINIREWFEGFFTVEDGTRGVKDDGVLFDKTQIGYMPEGFEMVNELLAYVTVQYEFKNKTDEYFMIRVSRDKALLKVDNEEISKEVLLNDAGYEYTMTYKDDTSETVLMWKDDNEIYYFLTGTVDSSELIHIMNNISY